MKNILYLLSFFLSAQVMADTYPPTTSKGSADTANVYTYNFQFPNFTGTHTGDTFSLGVNGVAGGGTGTGTAFTTGSVIFAGAGGVYTQNNAKLFWDNTNYRLGIGTATPTQPIDIGTGIVRAGAIVSAAATPTVTFGAGAGTGVTGINSLGSQFGGYLSFNTGTGPTAAVVFTLTMPVTCPTHVVCSFTAANANTAAIWNYFFEDTSATGCSIDTTGRVALGAATNYAFNYTSICY